jgi:hypothetical protein
MKNLEFLQSKLRSILVFIIYLMIFVLIVFAPRIYTMMQSSDATQPLEWLNFIAVFDPVAIATILLAAATFALVRDSSKNIEISKNNLVEERLVKEMEDLIKPIYMERDVLEYREWVHVPYYDETRSYELWKEEAKEFWNRLEADRYLAPADLRKLIQDYSQTNKDWLAKQERLAKLIKDALTKENKIKLCKDAPRDHYDVWPGYFDYRFINLPGSKDKDKRKEEIKELTDGLDPASESIKYIEEFVRLIDEDTILEAKRSSFKEKVIERYGELEREMDKVRNSLS